MPSLLIESIDSMIYPTDNIRKSLYRDVPNYNVCSNTLSTCSPRSVRKCVHDSVTRARASKFTVVRPYLHMASLLAIEGGWRKLLKFRALQVIFCTNFSVYEINMLVKSTHLNFIENYINSSLVHCMHGELKGVVPTWYPAYHAYIVCSRCSITLP